VHYPGATATRGVTGSRPPEEVFEFFQFTLRRLRCHLLRRTIPQLDRTIGTGCVERLAVAGERQSCHGAVMGRQAEQFQPGPHVPQLDSSFPVGGREAKTVRTIAEALYF